MGLSFSSFLDSSKDQSGIQFMSSGAEPVYVAHTTGAGEETVYTVPAGKILFIAKIIITGTGPTTWRKIILDATHIFEGNTDTAHGNYRELDFSTPLAVAGGTVIYSECELINHLITFVGWIQ